MTRLKAKAKFKRMRHLAIGICAAATFLAGEAMAAGSSFYYNPAAGLPTSQGWDLVEIGPPSPAPSLITDPSLPGGAALHQGLTSYGGYQFWTATGFDSDLFTDTLDINLDMQVISSSYFNNGGLRRAGWNIVISGVAVAGSVPFIALYATEDRVFLNTTNSGLTPEDSTEYFMDTTDTYHNYRVQLDAGVATVYIDGVLIPALTTTISTEFHSPAGAQLMSFGDGTALADSETLVAGFMINPPDCGVPQNANGQDILLTERMEADRNPYFRYDMGEITATSDGNNLCFDFDQDIRTSSMPPYYSPLDPGMICGVRLAVFPNFDGLASYKYGTTPAAFFDDRLDVNPTFPHGVANHQICMPWVSLGPKVNRCEVQAHVGNTLCWDVQPKKILDNGGHSAVGYAIPSPGATYDLTTGPSAVEAESEPAPKPTASASREAAGSGSVLISVSEL